MFRGFPRPTFLPHGGNIPRGPSGDDSLRSKVLPERLARKIARSIHEAARDKRAQSQRPRPTGLVPGAKEGRELFAHLKRIPGSIDCASAAQTEQKDEFLLAAIAQNLRKLRSSSRSRHPYSPHAAEGLGLPRLQLPPAHIAVFRAPGTSTIRRLQPSALRRVGVWRGDVRLGISVPAPFVWRCLSGSALARFHTPLIEPDVQISRIRLLDKTSRLRPRHVVPQPGQTYEPEVPVEVREWISSVLKVLQNR